MPSAANLKIKDRNIKISAALTLGHLGRFVGSTDVTKKELATFREWNKGEW